MTAFDCSWCSLGLAGVGSKAGHTGNTAANGWPDMGSGRGEVCVKAASVVLCEPGYRFVHVYACMVSTVYTVGPWSLVTECLGQPQQQGQGLHLPVVDCWREGP